MYKKLYREAMDEIPVNTALMEKLKCEAAGSRKKSRWSFQYRYGYVAAAILLLVVSAKLLPGLTQKPIVAEPAHEGYYKYHTEDVTLKQKIREAEPAEAKENLPMPTRIAPEEATDSTASEALLYDMYIEKFGFSYSEETLPEGLVMTDGVHFSSEGNPESTHCITYQGSGKMMSVTFYPEGEVVRDMIDAMTNGPKREEKYLFEEKAENEYMVYLAKEERGYVIEALGIEKEELKRFADSI